MERGNLFSSLECFISPQSKQIYYDETKKRVEDVLFENGCMIHSFLNEFVTLIILTEEEYNPFIEKHPHYQFLPCVTPHWILHSILNETMLPFESYNPNPQSLFSECYFYIISNKDESAVELSDVLTHFGGSLVFDKNAYITHYIICNSIQTSHLIKGRTANGIEVLSEEDIWDCIIKKKRLRPYIKPTSKFIDMSTTYNIESYQQINQSELFKNCLFLLFISHPYERNLLHQLIQRNEGEVYNVSHSLDASALFYIQNTQKQVISISYTDLPILDRISQFCKNLWKRSPYYIYDMVEHAMDIKYELLYQPHRNLNLYSYCFSITCSTEYTYYKRLIESCNGLVTSALPNSVILVEDVDTIPPSSFSNCSTIISLQWIIDSIQRNTFLPFSMYTINK